MGYSISYALTEIAETVGLIETDSKEGWNERYALGENLEESFGFDGESGEIFEEIEIPKGEKPTHFSSYIGEHGWDKNTTRKLIRDYFSTYVTNIQNIMLEFQPRMLDLQSEKSLEELMIWLKDLSQQHGIPHENLLLEDVMWEAFEYNKSYRKERDLYVRSELLRKIKDRSVESYVAAIELWEDIGIEIPFEVLHFSNKVVNPKAKLYFEAILIDFISWLSKQELIDISQLITSLKLSPYIEFLPGQYEPVIKKSVIEFFEQYQSQYEALSS